MVQFHASRARLAIAAMSLATVTAFGSFVWQQGATGQDSDQSTRTAEKAPQHQAEQLSRAFRRGAEVALPTVVTVRSRTKPAVASRNRSQRSPRENPFRGTPFEDFFRDFEGGEGSDFGPRGGGARQGMGSGVIVDKSGIVLTNNHVVEGADEVIVHLPDGREFKAEDIKTDPQTDLAVLRIRGAGSLPAAPLGNSDNLEIGDWVLAVGNPFELEQTVSAGIISGKGRELSQNRAKFLQTDAAINPGNSGGPLVNLDGEVVGINTAIATSSGSFAGIGFAIPVNTAKWVMGQLIERGEVERAYLGVQIGEVSAEVAEQVGAERGQGVIVTQVYPKTPAAEAGLEEGDVITEINGKRVKSPRDLQEIVERATINSKLQLSVLHNGREKNVQVVAKPLPRDFGVASARSPRVQRGQNSRDGFEAEDLGIEVEDITREHLQQLGLEDATGVVITQVDPNSVAAEQGLREGMIISKVGKRNVKNVEDFKAAVEDESLKDGVLLLVRTRTGNRFVVLSDK
jgi:serine protease Do